MAKFGLETWRPSWPLIVAVQGTGRGACDKKLDGSSTDWGIIALRAGSMIHSVRACWPPTCAGTLDPRMRRKV